MGIFKKVLFGGLKLLTANYYFQRKSKSKLVVLMFHQVNDNQQIFYPATPVSVFKEVCVFLKTHFEVIALHQIEEHFSKSDKPAAVISFDDGHFDIIQNALPILSDLDLPFNVNIDTQALVSQKPQDYVKVYDILNQCKLDDYFNEELMERPIEIDYSNPFETEKAFTHLITGLTVAQRLILISDLEELAGIDNEIRYSKMLSEYDLKSLSHMNVEVGSHTHTHTDLTTLTENEMIFELKKSKEILESILKKEVDILAYPNGKYDEKVRSVAQAAGYNFFLETDDLVNIISLPIHLNRYKRINIYHQTTDEALAYIFGVTQKIRSLLT